MEVKCSDECDCKEAGCDCDTLQNKLDDLKNDLQTDTENKYQSILAKLDAIPVTADNKDLLLEIKNLINDVKKGILVVLNDGDDNTITR